MAARTLYDRIHALLLLDAEVSTLAVQSAEIRSRVEDLETRRGDEQAAISDFFPYGDTYLVVGTKQYRVTRTARPPFVEFTELDFQYAHQIEAAAAARLEAAEGDAAEGSPGGPFDAEGDPEGPIDIEAMVAAAVSARDPDVREAMRLAALSL